MQILIVDDAKTILHVLGSLLREIGYFDIIEAEHVEKAIQVCKKSVPTLIISDWNMPGATGLDFLRWVRGNPDTADVPFIILTTEKDRNKIVEATRAGIQAYLLKPIKKQVLVEKLRELSQTYGFSPPPESGQPSMPVSQKSPGSEPLVRGKLKKEHIASILDVYGKLWKKEITVKEFESFVRELVPGGVSPEKNRDAGHLLDYIQEAAREGILNKLMQLV